MNAQITLCSDNGLVRFSDGEVTLLAETDSEDTRFSLTVEFPEWEEDAYILLPACVYDGNRFKRKKASYLGYFRI